MRPILLTLMLALLLAGCSRGVKDDSPGASKAQQQSSSRYSMKHDRYPTNPPDVSKVPDAVPRYEPPSRGGNQSPYQVFGQTYHVLPSAEGYREIGGASWYGEKFHGHLTSNGEVYDMYAMTAAHKSLPLPTFARVTNLDNGRSVVVRINDRGPFHEDRIIDLSYAAAHRIDILRNGTGRVKVEAITVPPDNRIYARHEPPSAQQVASRPHTAPPITPVNAQGRYLQVAAFSSEQSAQSLQNQLVGLSQGLPVGIYRSDDGRALYRVKIGPLAGAGVEGLMARLNAAGFGGAYLVDRP